MPPALRPNRAGAGGIPEVSPRSETFECPQSLGV